MEEQKNKSKSFKEMADFMERKNIEFFVNPVVEFKNEKNFVIRGLRICLINIFFYNNKKTSILE